MIENEKPSTAEEALSPETRAALQKAQAAPIDEQREAAIVRENRQEMARPRALVVVKERA